MKSFLPVLIIGAAAVFGCAGDREPAGTPIAEPAGTVRTSEPGTDSRGADWLVELAQRDERGGRDDDARINYQLAFRRDRWHPAANRLYQDLMLKNDLFKVVWQEYLDLYQRNLDRGDALYYHLRPMLSRLDEASGPEPQPKLGQPSSMAEQIAQATAPADGEELIVKIRKYRELAEENPASGARAYLYTLALGSGARRAQIEVVRSACALELPGFWVRYALADIALSWAEDLSHGRARIGEDRSRQIEALVALGLSAYHQAKRRSAEATGDLAPPDDLLDSWLRRLQDLNDDVDGKRR